MAVVLKRGRETSILQVVASDRRHVPWILLCPRLRRVGTVVGWSQAEGRSHLTARIHASHLSAFCQRSSWLSSLGVKQVSLISFVEKILRLHS